MGISGSNFVIAETGTTLTVTNEQTTLRRGLLSKFTNDVFHSNVRNIIVRQSFFQRLMGVGYVGISSSGQSGSQGGASITGSGGSMSSQSDDGSEGGASITGGTSGSSGSGRTKK